MKIGHSGSYYLKRIFSKASTWIILILHLSFAAFFIWTTQQGKGMKVTINTNNDLFRQVFGWQIIIMLIVWTFIISPLSWLFWGQIDDLGQETQTDGTDLFFLSTQVPTSREQVFGGKVISLSCLSTILYLLFYASPITIFLGRMKLFTGFSDSQLYSYLAFSFLVIPLFLFIPLTIFFFSLCSLKSVGYAILKWLLRLSVIVGLLFIYLVYQAIYQGGEWGIKIIIWFTELFLGLDQNYLLVISVSIGVIFLLACLTLTLAYKKFQEEDLS